jgi:hypothetical protein
MGPRSSALLLAILAGAVTSVAHADDRAAAQQLFLEGKELMRAGTFEQACQKFEAASQLSSTPGVRLNLADCLEKLGHTASAWARFDEALSMAERNGDGAAAELARKGRARLEPQLAYLTIVVPPAAVVAGLEVKRDGETLPKAAWGTGIPVDPGDHEVSAEAPNRARWSKKTAVVGSGAKVTVEVPPLAPAMERPP